MEGAGERRNGIRALLQQAHNTGFGDSIVMVLTSELGDETFITAAILAMRARRGEVLAGSLLALALMTVLSTALGMMAPLLITKATVSKVASVLYLAFALRLLYIGMRSSQAQHDVQHEVSEVEGKLSTSPPESPSEHSLANGTAKSAPTNASSWHDNSAGAGTSATPAGTKDSSSSGRSFINAVRNLLSKMCTRAFAEAFLLTFLAEWGDRSQVTTIMLAGHKSPIGVTIGALVGHTVCTTLAVVGGKLLALRISPRAVALSGGCLFLIFAITTFRSSQLEDASSAAARSSAQH